jgi:hypothetical protein
MKGTVEIFDGDFKVFEKNNLNVDGAYESVVDIFTHKRTPSSILNGAINAVSSYTVNAISLGPPKQNLHMHDSRFGLYKTYTTGIEYLDISGAGSGIHVPHLNLVNRNLEEFGNAGQKSADQPSYYAARQYFHYSEILQYVKVFPTTSDVVLELTENSFTFHKKYGQSYAEINLPLETKFGEDLLFEIKGYGDIEIAVIAKNNFNTYEGGTQYFNFESGNFSPIEYRQSVKLTGGVTKVPYDSRYYQQDAYDIEGGIATEYILQITIPKRNVYTKDSAYLEFVRIQAFDSLFLNNPNFNRNESWLRNSSFENFTYDEDTSLEIAKTYGFVDLKGWSKISFLEKASNPTLSSLGYVSVNKDSDGLYYVELNSSSLEGSGSAGIIQDFSPNPKLYNALADTAPFKSYALLSFDLYQASAQALGVTVELQDNQTNEYFSFQASGAAIKGTWGVNSPLTVGTHQYAQLRRYSALIPMQGRLVHNLKLTFKANGTSIGEFASYRLRNVFFGNLTGWEYINANPLSGTVELAAFEDGSGLVLSSTQVINPVNKFFENTVNVGATFAGLEPKKKYALVIDASPLTSSTADLGILITHHSLTNINDKFREHNQGANIGLINLNYANGKNPYIGYLRYLNIATSPSAVLSPYGDQEVYRKDYVLEEAAVAFNAEFQTSSTRLFVPIANGSVKTSWSITDKFEYEEDYLLGFRIHAKNPGQKELWFNSETNSWDSFENYEDPIQLASGTYGYDLHTIENVSFDIPNNIFNDYKTDNSVCMILEFRGIRNGGSNLTFSGTQYFHNFEVLNRWEKLDDPNWYENKQTPVAYYAGSGVWNLSSFTGADLGSLSKSVVPNSIISATITNDSQVFIPIYGMDAFNGSFTSVYNPTSITVGGTPYSTYSVFLFPLQGSGMLIKKCSLVDYSLAQYNGDTDIRDRNLITSENLSYVIPDDFVNGWHIHLASSVSHDSTIPYVYANKYQGIKGLTYSRQTTNPRPIHACYTTKVGDHKIVGEKFKISFDHFGDATPNYALSAGLLYHKTSGDSLIWDWNKSKFSPYENGLIVNTNLSGYLTISGFPYLAGNTNLEKNFISSAITLPVERDPNDKLTFFARIDDVGANAAALIRNLRFYSLVSATDASSYFPEFPNPTDRTLQSSGTGSEEFGHFMNRIEYYNKDGRYYRDYEDALYDGAYLPAEGIPMYSGGTYTTYYGSLNKFGVITPNGFILEQKKTTRASQTIGDTSAGMIISSTNPTVTKQVKYGISLTKAEWYLLNKYYGGIGALGLWTIDYVNTAKKIGSDYGTGGPPFITSGEPTSVIITAGAPAALAGPVVPGGEQYINSYVFKAQALTKKGRALFHTDFSGLPGRYNPNGWAVSGHQYMLKFDYKTTGNNVKVISDHFAPSALQFSSGWDTKYIYFTASATGLNRVLFSLRDESDPIDSDYPELLIDNLTLSSITENKRKYFSAFAQLSAIDRYKTNYSLPNKIELSRVFNGGTYTTSLYMESDLIEFEPIFRLFSKIVFFPGGLQLSPGSNYLTIIWTVDF